MRKHQNSLEFYYLREELNIMSFVHMVIKSVSPGMPYDASNDWRSVDGLREGYFEAPRSNLNIGKRAKVLCTGTESMNVME